MWPQTTGPAQKMCVRTHHMELDGCAIPLSVRADGKTHPSDRVAEKRIERHQHDAFDGRRPAASFQRGENSCGDATNGRRRAMMRPRRTAGIHDHVAAYLFALAMASAVAISGSSSLTRPLALRKLPSSACSGSRTAS